MALPTKLQFETYGMDSLDAIPESAWAALTGPITIHLYSEEVKVNPQVEVAKTGYSYLLEQTDDILVTGDLKKVEVLLTGPAKMIVSTDSGVTWKTFSTAWQNVNKEDIETVKSVAMSKETLASVVQTEWAKPTKLRFAFLIEIATPTDKVVLSNVKLTTVPDATTTPSVGMLGIEVKELSIEGRLKELERMNSIQLGKLNFKAGAILGADQLMLHDMTVDLFDTDTADTLSVVSGQSIESQSSDATGATLEDGTMYTVVVDAAGAKIKKVEVV